MIPASFDYEVAESADPAVALLGPHGEDAKQLAGGHSLLPQMRVWAALHGRGDSGDPDAAEPALRPSGSGGSAP